MATINAVDNNSGPFTVSSGSLSVSNGTASVSNDGTTGSPTGVIGLNQTSNNVVGGVIQITKQHGTGNPIVSGDTVGNYSFYGFDGTNYVQTATIASLSSGTVAANRVAGNLIFFTHPDSASGGLGATARMTLSSAGNLTINPTDSGTLFNLSLLGTSQNNGLGIYNSSTTLATDIPFVSFIRSRNSGANVNGDYIGQIAFAGTDSSSITVVNALIRSVVDNTVSAGVVPLSLGLYTGSTTGAIPLRLNITSAGNVVINTPDSGIALNSPATYGQAGLGATTQVMIIDSTGNIGSSSALTSSSVIGTIPNTNLSSAASVLYNGPYSAGNATSTLVQYLMPATATLSNLYVNVLTNASTSNITVTLYVNGSATSVVATITALTTGIFSDTTHTATIFAGQYFYWQVQQGTVGVAVGGISMKIKA